MAKAFEKTNGFLMEMILMILFFSVSAAVCLQLFAFAHGIQKQSTAKNEALLYAQTLAEELKTTDAALLLQAPEQTETLYLDDSWQKTQKELAAYTAQVALTHQRTAAGELVSATVTVCFADSDEQPLCALPATVYLPDMGGVTE